MLILLLLFHSVATVRHSFMLVKMGDIKSVENRGTMCGVWSKATGEVKKITD